MTTSQDLILPNGVDEDLFELVEMYVDEMPSRIAALQAAYDAGDDEALRRQAHQIKGSGAGYGFDVLSNLARGLEFSVRDGEDRSVITESYEALLDACSRVRAS